MPAEWRDRFDPSSYADDQPVHVFRCDQYGPNDGGLWLPERIWHRLRRLGLAYELHLLPLLDGSTDPVFLNPVQVGQLVREFRFVGELVDDPIVESHVHALISLSGERSDGASTDMIGTPFATVVPVWQSGAHAREIGRPVIEDFTAWRDELLFTGKIVQDGDTSVDPVERDSRWRRYAGLLELVEGDEDDAVFETIFDSMTAPEDYEVYQWCFGAAFRFPQQRFGALLFRVFQNGYFVRDPERAGDWLGQLAFLGAESDAVVAFNDQWSQAGDSFSAVLLEFILENEEKYRWLSSPDQVGVLRPGGSTPEAVRRANEYPVVQWAETSSGGAYCDLRSFRPDH